MLRPRLAPELVSLVAPLYNEEAVVGALRAELTKLLGRLESPAEVVLVDDGSTDRTPELLEEWARADARVRVLRLSRNFGHQAAATAGLDHARGEAVVLMDADLQDPPEAVIEMLAKYREGYDVVYGVRARREGETWFKRATAWLFYRLMRALVDPNLPADAGDFRLLSRRALDALNSMRELHRFLRGMTVWVGFPQAAVVYTRGPRAAGETKYPLWRMLRFAWHAAISFSPLPLRLSFALGLASSAFGLIYGAWAVAVTVMGVRTAPGWTSLVALTAFIGGAILLSIGVLGEYVGKIFEEIKRRPLYVVESVLTADQAERGGDREAKRGHSSA